MKSKKWGQKDGDWLRELILSHHLERNRGLSQPVFASNQAIV
jgi:hypothetical protein